MDGRRTKGGLLSGTVFEEIGRISPSKSACNRGSGAHAQIELDSAERRSEKSTMMSDIGSDVGTNFPHEDFGPAMPHRYIPDAT
jgi:hypothetical protein